MLTTWEPVCLGTMAWHSRLTCPFQHRHPERECWFHPNCSTSNAAPRGLYPVRHQVAAQVLRPSTPTWKTKLEFLAPAWPSPGGYNLLATEWANYLFVILPLKYSFGNKPSVDNHCRNHIEKAFGAHNLPSRRDYKIALSHGPIFTKTSVSWSRPPGTTSAMAFKSLGIFSVLWISGFSKMSMRNISFLWKEDKKQT